MHGGRQDEKDDDDDGGERSLGRGEPHDPKRHQEAVEDGPSARAELVDAVDGHGASQGSSA
jgi:hypothetical protein